MKIYTRYITHTHVQMLNILSKILADIGFNPRQRSVFIKNWWIISLNSGSLWKWQHALVQNQYERHQKSKTGVSVAPKMDMCPTKINKKPILTTVMQFFLKNMVILSQMRIQHWNSYHTSTVSLRRRPNEAGKFSTYPWYHGYMSAPGTLEWLNPSEWPISWAATENRLVPA